MPDEVARKGRTREELRPEGHLESPLCFYSCAHVETRQRGSDDCRHSRASAVPALAPITLSRGSTLALFLRLRRSRRRAILVPPLAPLHCCACTVIPIS